MPDHSHNGNGNGALDLAEMHRQIRRTQDIQLEHHETQRRALANQSDKLDLVVQDVADIKAMLRRAQRASLADPAELERDPHAVGLGATPSLWQRARASQWSTIAMVLGTALATAATTYATSSTHQPKDEGRTVGETARPSIGWGGADAGKGTP